MTYFKSDFLHTLHSRGFIHQGTDLEGLDQKMAVESIVGYIGFDATAKSLHVGSLVQIMLLYWLQQTGHKPVVLFGGATSRIGDPSDKNEMRKLLSKEDIALNIQSLSRVFSQILKIGNGKTDAIVVNNADWLDQINYLEFLRVYGPHFSINRMVSFDIVKRRLEQELPLSFLEFNYMLLQAYDFLELSKRYNVSLEMGGADQWVNILNGVDLIRRIKQKIAFGFTTALITTASGAKMGKTAQGAIWLNADSLAPYDFWQFWRNTEDKDVGKFLRLFTPLPLEEITKLEKLQGAEINHAKKVLADSVTEFLHGRMAVEEARKTAETLFESQGNLDTSTLPTISLTPQEVQEGLSLIDLFCRLNFATSKGEARRLIQGGGARLDDQVIEDPQQMLIPDDLQGKEYIKLSAGKKKHGLVKIS